MKLKILLAAALMAGGPATPVFAQESGETFILRVFGKSTWRVECVMETDRGTSRPKARGRGSTSSGSVVARDALSGSCTAEASPRGPLQLTLVDNTGSFDCPFGDMVDDLCRASIAPGDEYAFDVSLN
ncbi:MAG: hypothetical protein AAFX03_13450 [Pseudomonadota bacterium]